MSQFTELLPPTKSEKHGALTWEPATGLLTLMGKRNFCRYRLEEYGADFGGRAFMLFKVDAGTDTSEERYACLVGPHGSRMCECRGFYYSGGCKHLEALATLIDAGKI